MIKDICYAVFGCQDLDEARPFLTDFGLTVSAEQPGCIYFRGAQERPYIFVLRKAEKPGLLAIGYELDSEASLYATAERLGVSVAPISENPWGGLRAVVSDCDGNRVELVHGLRSLEPLPLPREEVVFNSGGKIRRKGRLPHFEDGPTPVLQLAHVVHTSLNPQRFVDWYVENLGAYPSDVLMGPEQPVATFMRFPNGSEYVDHHNVAVFAGKGVGVQHLCFESLDLDAVFMAHRYLRSKGYRQSWGPVRHLAGGAISDYWITPWGLRVEHVTDGDVLNDQFETSVAPFDEGTILQWTTQPVPAEFGE